MKYRVVVQIAGATSGVVTSDLGFATMMLNRLTGTTGVEWIGFEASASGVFTPVIEGTAVIESSDTVSPDQLDLLDELPSWR